MDARAQPRIPGELQGREYCPILSPDGKYLFLTSYRGFADEPLPRRLESYDELLQKLRSTLNGSGNVFQIDMSAVHEAGAGR